MNKAVITQLNNIQFLFIYEDERLAECHPLPGESGGSSLQIGDICIGRVEKKVKNIEAAFIRVDGDNVGYLPLDDKPYICLNRSLPKGLSSIAENDLILVQVEAEPQKQKQARVTGNIGLSGQYVALDLRGNMFGISKKIHNPKRILELKALFENRRQYGVVLRTACEQAADADIVAEYEALTAQLDQLIARAFYERRPNRCYTGQTAYMQIMEAYGFERIDEIETDILEIYEELSDRENSRLYDNADYPLSKLLSLQTELTHILNKKVWLKSGGFLVIEPTEAMVVIDVNSGKSIGKKKMETHIYETNLEAAEEITRQLRLRNLSGIIMIDFINMDNEDYKKNLVRTLEDGIRKDKINTHFIEVTKLDVFELTRKKVRRPLHEVVGLSQNELYLKI